jgi:hypothetical protein
MLYGHSSTLYVFDSSNAHGPAMRIPSTREVHQGGALGAVFFTIVASRVYTQLAAISPDALVAYTLALFTGLHREHKIPNHQSSGQARPKYKVNVRGNTNPLIETMKPYMTMFLGSDVLNAKTVALLSAAWAPSTTTTCGSTIRRCFNFCEEHILAPLAAAPAHMARHVAWLG